MNRHLARVIAMQTLYEWDFQANRPLEDMLVENIKATDHGDDDVSFPKQLIETVANHVAEIDNHITKSAPEWPLDQISVVDKSILRLAIGELLYTPDTPAKVVINEAVELAKTYGGDNTSRFVNGVLGTIYRTSLRYKVDQEREAMERKYNPKAKEKGK